MERNVREKSTEEKRNGAELEVSQRTLSKALGLSNNGATYDPNFNKLEACLIVFKNEVHNDIDMSLKKLDLDAIRSERLNETVEIHAPIKTYIDYQTFNLMRCISIDGICYLLEGGLSIFLARDKMR
ncbi:Uncharacterized protein Fot_14486 [Forsythia ovata]|uniref:Uncharacterized protein n=1 Tax=Forsythia ovata TaxID=205694 RepID=A0ABD1W904_9LAMI